MAPHGPETQGVGGSDCSEKLKTFQGEKLLSKMGEGMGCTWGGVSLLPIPASEGLWSSVFVLLPFHCDALLVLFMTQAVCSHQMTFANDT